MNRSTWQLIWGATIAGLVSAAVSALVVYGIGSSFESTSRLADVATCDSGNLSRAWNLYRSRNTANGRDEKLATARFRLRDCPSSYPQGRPPSPVYLSTGSTADYITAFVAAPPDRQPRYRNGRVTLVPVG